MQSKSPHSRPTLFGLTLARNFGALSLSQVIARAIGFLYMIALARFLGPDDVGIIVYGVALYIVLTSVAMFGQGVFLSTRLGRSRCNADTVVSHSLAVVLAVALLAMIAGAVFVRLSEPDPKAALAVGLFVATIGPRVVAGWVRHCSVALEQAAWIPKYELAFRVSEAVAGLSLLLLGGGLLAICAVHLAAWVLECCFAVRRLSRVEGLKLHFRLDRRFLKPLLRASLYFTLSLLLLNLHAQIGVLGLRLLQPDSAVVGYFGIALQFITTVILLPLTLGQAALPALSRGYRRGGQGAAELVLVLKLALITGGFLAVLAHAYGASIITTLFGQRFAEAGAVLATLGWVLGPYAVTVLAIQLLNGIGGRGLATILAVVMALGQIVILVVCLPFGALMAATAALLVANCLGCLLGVLFIHRRLGIEGHGWWLRPALAVGAAGAVMWSGVLPDGLAAAVALAVLLLSTWLLRIFQSRDFDVFRTRLQASTG